MSINWLELYFLSLFDVFILFSVQTVLLAYILHLITLVEIQSVMLISHQPISHNMVDWVSCLRCALLSSIDHCSTKAIAIYLAVPSKSGLLHQTS